MAEQAGVTGGVTTHVAKAQCLAALGTADAVNCQELPRQSSAGQMTFAVLTRSGWIRNISSTAPPFEEDEPAQNQLRDRIGEGDRIAIKKMLGRGAADIEIRALGVVTEVDPEDHRVYVRWAISNLGRTVPSRECFASIHGPFAADDEWTRLVFQL
jgi:hypothetical protein